MLTFVGEGYTPGFTDNYRRIAQRLSAGEEIEIVAGPDDICAPLLSEKEPHCNRPSVAKRDAAALADVAVLLDNPIAPGMILTLTPDLLARLRGNFNAGSIRSACNGCEWEALCSRIAGNAFEGTLVNRS